MISTTRKWLRRNRSKFAVGLGVVGVGYVAGRYVLNKISETKERMSIDRIARENLRRRFQQNQEDCTFTVLALLPTAAEDILESLPVESITHELQQQKAEKLGRSQGASEIAPSDLSSGSPSITEEDGRSLSSFQTESFIHTSQMAGSNLSGEAGARPKRTKAQLWNELKISSITRAFTLIYTLSLLTLLTRIQLNLLGRRNYLSSVVSLAIHSSDDTSISLENNDDDRGEQSYGNDFETNRKFLTFSWWLLHRGWRDITGKVELAVKDVFGPLNPREDVSTERLSSLILNVREKFEGATKEERRHYDPQPFLITRANSTSNLRWLPYLLPPLDQEEFVLQESGMSPTPPSTSGSPSPSPLQDPAFTQSRPPSPSSSQTALRRLLNETSDLIDSPTFSHILTLILDVSFSHLTDDKLRSQAFKLPLINPNPTTIEPTLRVQEISEGATSEANAEASPSSAPVKTKLATILAVMTRQAHAIGNGVPNEYVQAIESVKELEAFAAVIYSSNFAFEAEGRSSSGGDTPFRGDVTDDARTTVEGVVSVTEAGETVRAEGERRDVVEGIRGMAGGVWGMVTGV